VPKIFVNGQILLQLIIKNVVTCFFGTQCRMIGLYAEESMMIR